MKLKSAKVKHNYPSITYRINDMCKHFNLPEEVKENITRIAKDSYIKGSNDCYRIYVYTEYMYHAQKATQYEFKLK